MNVARNVMIDARLVPGGGACEMATAHVSNYGVFISIYSSILVLALYLYQGDYRVQKFYQLTGSSCQTKFRNWSKKVDFTASSELGEILYSDSRRVVIKTKVARMTIIVFAFIGDFFGL